MEKRTAPLEKWGMAWYNMLRVSGIEQPKGKFIMFRVPVTYFFDFVSVTDRMRPYIMAEFAAAGAKHTFSVVFM